MHAENHVGASGNVEKALNLELWLMDLVHVGGLSVSFKGYSVGLSPLVHVYHICAILGVVYHCS